MKNGGFCELFVDCWMVEKTVALHAAAETEIVRHNTLDTVMDVNVLLM